ncbi:MAG: Xaa-Pro dipeptidyl-peptidase [Gemmatimonadetes bacterium]|nr:Xaa-Pro dipeptidyl-peptidase [Gemmatimonadota bacterium]
MRALPLLAGLALAACRTAPAPVGAQAVAPAGARTPLSASAPALAAPYVIVDGQAQVVAAFADSTRWIREHLWVETEFDSDFDGKRDRVHVDVTRPGPTADGLRVPVVYETSPYFAGTLGEDPVFWPVAQEPGDEPPARTLGKGVPYRPGRTMIALSQVRAWVPRGFAVVHSESPGTGLSQGCVTIGGMNESLAPKAVIDWLNGRAKGYTTVDGATEVRATWATGKVGMIGTSFNGTLPVAVATTGVAGLEAIIPVSPNNSYYRYYRSNGLVRSPGGYLGEDVDVLYDFVQSGNPAMRATCDARVRDAVIRAGIDRRTGDLNDFWTGRDYLLQARGIRAAMLTAHGFNDWNVMPSHTTLMAEAVRRNGTPVQMYFHQGGHGGEPPMPMMNRWFTRYLLGVANGVEQDPRAWVVREGAGRAQPTPYADWPNPAAAPVTLRPGRGGATMGTLVSQLAGSQERETLTDDVALDGAQLARASASPHRLLYATPVLTAPVHLSGTPRVSITLSADRAAANLSVWLVELPYPDSLTRAAPYAGIITRGWADPQNARSLRASEPLVPGQPVTVTFDLEPDDQVIPAGKRIALMVFASDREFTLWPKPGTALTVELDRTTLTLPVVGGAAGARTAGMVP